MDNAAPTCPECGSKMVIRTARTGASAGQNFYGCSTFPRCRTIIPIAIVGSDSQHSPTLSLVHLSASPRDDNSQVTFFQASALSSAIVETIHSSDIAKSDSGRQTIRAAAQWRLDYPLPKNVDSVQEIRPLLAIAESILTRGTTPLCSPTLEEALGEATRQSHTQALLEASMVRIVDDPTVRFSSVRYDSDAEQSFAGWLSDILSSEMRPWHVTPQIHLASLSPKADEMSGERGDFLLTHQFLPSILVEIDGMGHTSHRDRDAERDRIVAASGVRVIRIHAHEVREGNGPELSRLRDLLLESEPLDSSSTNLDATIRLFKFAHQIQIALLEAIRGGWIVPETGSEVAILIPDVLATDPRSHGVATTSAGELLELVSRLGRLYGKREIRWSVSVTVLQSAAGSNSVVVGPADEKSDSMASDAAARFLISDVCFPSDIAAPQTTTQPIAAADPDRETARWFLEYLFRKQDFKEGQWEAVSRALQAKDSVVLLPTGAGKSIAFQLAAMLRPGRCIVIDPIVSLIEDQIDNLAQYGINRCVGITSQLESREDRERATSAFASGHFLFCYVAPERFQTTMFREALRQLTVSTPVSLIAIDEAHCVSEWGHDFRTAYLNLGRITREYCKSHGTNPPIMALTGTASKIVLKDVQRELSIIDFEAIITPVTFDRPELQFTVLTCRASEKASTIQGFIDGLPTIHGISRSQFFAPSGNQTQAGWYFVHTLMVA